HPARAAACLTSGPRHELHAHARDRLFPRRIDLREEYRVSRRELHTEALREVAGAGEEMRLERGDQTPSGKGSPRRRQGCTDLRRMVRVVIHDGHTGCVPDPLEPTLHTHE